MPPSPHLIAMKIPNAAHVGPGRTAHQLVDRVAQPVCGIGEDGAMTTYSGSQLFEGATFVKTSFEGAAQRFCDVSGVKMRSVDVDGLDIDSHDLFFGGLFVNGVDVVPLVDAELNASSRVVSCRRRRRPRPARWLGRGAVRQDGPEAGPTGAPPDTGLARSRL
jgi:hypothetical protein